MRRGLCRLCARGPYERGLERYLQTHARSRAFAFLDQGRRNGAILECLRDAIVAQCGPALWPRVLRALRCHRTQDLEELLQGPARFHDTIAALVAQERGRTEGRARATSPAPPPALAPRLAAVWAAVQPREAYVRERDELRAAVERKLAPLARGAPPRVYLFGSAAMGLCLADADVDLACDAVEGPQWRGVHAQDRRREQRAFLREALATLGEYGPLAVVKDARVPVLRKFGAPQGGALNWDLSCRMIGVANAQVIRQYVDAYPVVRPLCVLLKDWAKVTKVINAHNRYLSTYALTLMVLHYLLRCGAVAPLPPPPSPRDAPLPKWHDAPAPMAEVAAHFWGFLEYFVYEFEHREAVVSIGAPAPLQKAQLGWEERAFCVQDPVDEAFNITQNMFESQYLQCQFLMYVALQHLEAGTGRLFSVERMET